MKKLLAFLILALVLIKWSGTHGSNIFPSLESQGKSNKIALTQAFPIGFYEKEVDFDDLLEFTSTPVYTINGDFINTSDELCSDNANNENRQNSYKSFNKEYDSIQDLYKKCPDCEGPGKTIDRYACIIPHIFLSPIGLPPEYGVC